MIRVPNSDIALVLWSRTVIGKPYVWGETDCGSLFRQAMTVMYGDDVTGAKPYKTKRAALSRYAETGGVEAILRRLGAIEVTKGAQTGDVLLEDGDDFPSAAVVVQHRAIFATPDAGVVSVPVRGRNGLLLRVPHG